MNDCELVLSSLARGPGTSKTIARRARLPLKRTLAALRVLRNSGRVSRSARWLTEFSYGWDYRLIEEERK